MTRLSVNVNKFATIRNARGGNNPDLVTVVKDCERFGAQGITVHPRPDERHITTKDVYEIADVVNTEYNIEGYPDERYHKLVEETKPAQATLVPDPPHVLTSNAGWNTVENRSFLKETVARLKESGVRVSVFLDPIPEMLEGAVEIGTDRIELYTESYARTYMQNPSIAVKSYAEVAEMALKHGIGINAGHDLDLNNLSYLCQHISVLEEVSIGHALVCDALYYGLENTIQMYLRRLGDV